ncbi:MAG: hypothetical protein DRJ40_02010 [Thermoprotei archaeon]|nr:MAG: hypothetical protein DRJ40_02010 [Thermoprotei archaeon]
MEVPEDVYRILMPEERIAWFSRPVPKVYLVQALPLTIFTIGFAVFTLAIVLSTAGPKVFRQPAAMIFFSIWFGLLALIGLLTPIARALECKNAMYIMTNRRLIKRKGVVGIDYDMIDLASITDVRINVGFWDRIYGTGTVIVKGIGTAPVRLEALERPYEVHRIILETMKRVLKERNC